MPNSTRRGYYKALQAMRLPRKVEENNKEKNYLVVDVYIAQYRFITFAKVINLNNISCQYIQIR